MKIKKSKGTTADSEDMKRSSILEQTAESIKAANRGISEEDISAFIDEALEWESMNRTSPKGYNRV